MKPGDICIIEWDIDGMLWEVDIEMLATQKIKNGVKRCQFMRLDDPTRKPYNFSKKQLNALLATEWEEFEGEEF